VSDLVKKHWHYLNKKGEIETIDVKTGKVISYDQPDKVDDLPKLVAINDGDRVVYVQKGYRLEDYHAEPKLLAKYVFSPLLGDVICQKIAEGGKIMEICQQEGFPCYAVFSKWRRENEDFASQVRQAIVDRGEMMADLALLAAEEAVTKDEVASQRLKFEARKWRASVDNPEKFQQRTKISGDANNPVTFVIETGVRRQGDDGCKDVTEKPVEIPEKTTT